MNAAQLLTAAMGLMLTALPAVGQQVRSLSPRAEALAPEKVLAGTDTFSIESYRDGALARSAQLIRTVDRVREGQRTLIRQTQVYHTPQGITSDTTWLDAGTLEPIRYVADVHGERHGFTFEPTRVCDARGQRRAQRAGGHYNRVLQRRLD